MNRRQALQCMCVALASVPSLGATLSAAEEYAIIQDALSNVPETITLTTGGRAMGTPSLDVEAIQVSPHIWDIKALGTSVGTVTFGGNENE